MLARAPVVIEIRRVLLSDEAASDLTVESDIHLVVSVAVCWTEIIPECSRKANPQPFTVIL